MRPSRLFPLLGEPGTGEPLELEPTALAGDEPFQGWVRRADGNVVGVLDSFRFRFVDFAPPPMAERASPLAVPPQVLHRAEVDFVSPFDPRIRYGTGWQPIGGYLMGTSTASSTGGEALFEVDQTHVDIIFHKHPWSGQATILANDSVIAEIDLFHPSTSIPCTVSVPQTVSRQVIRIIATGGRHSDSMGCQVIIEGLRYLDQRLSTPRYRKPPARNRGGSFHSRFHAITDNLASDAVILDVGGGKRQIADERYINLEYAAYEEADLFGDALNLPFRTGSVDFVYSAAVMEHVRDPLRMGREIVRVLKPGGVALVNSAFMQPVHSERQHFFNVTPYGIEEALGGLQDRQVFWEGDLSSMLDWFLQASGIKAKAAADEYDRFISMARTFDNYLDQAGLMYIASGVWLEGRKP